MPTYVQVQQIDGEQVRYPAFFDSSSGQTYLAASASGDGIADSGLWRIPIGEINGVTYFAAVRVLDNNSTVNASVADTRNVTTGNQPGDFFPTNVDLQSLLVSGSNELGRLDSYRCNGVREPTRPSTTTETRCRLILCLTYDAMWHQLGRRLDYPGYNSQSLRYQALPASDSVSLAYEFCLANPSASPSVVEQALNFSVLNASRPGFVPTVPYQAGSSGAVVSRRTSPMRTRRREHLLLTCRAAHCWRRGRR